MRKITKFYLKVLKSVFDSPTNALLSINLLAFMFVLEPVIVVFISLFKINEFYFNLKINNIYFILIFTAFCYLIHSVIRIMIFKHLRFAKIKINTVFSEAKGIVLLWLIVLVYNIPIIMLISIYLIFYV